MKKLLCTILSLLVLLTMFAGCDKKEETNEDSKSSESSTVTPVVDGEVVADVTDAVENFDGQEVQMSTEALEKFIADAIQKTDDCGTFEVVATMSTDYDGDKDEDMLEFKVKKQGDSYTYLREFSGYNPMDGNYVQQYYYNGNIGYETNGNVKIISDVNFNKEFIFDQMDALDMFVGIHKEVCKNNPTVQVDDSVYKIVARIPFDKIEEFLGEKTPDNVSGYYEFEYFEHKGRFVLP